MSCWPGFGPCCGDPPTPGLLVDELVQLATEGVDKEAIEVLDLGLVVREVAERAERRSGRSVVVAGAVSTTPLRVAGRRWALARALGNLVDNALKFSPPDTPVEVTLAAPARVEVRDHGPGGPRPIGPGSSSSFSCGAEARALPGSGLGLAIVAQTALAPAGSVTVRNDPAGGAVFTFDLPAADEG